MIMIGCIYHEADLDGVMSAAIVNKYFKRKDIDLLPYNYGQVRGFNAALFAGLRSEMSVGTERPRIVCIYHLVSFTL